MSLTRWCSALLFGVLLLAPRALLANGCDQPLPAGTVEGSVVAPVPADFDASVEPAPTTTTYFTLLLPERCPGQRFPLILHSHGYGGSRIRSLAADATLFPDSASFSAIDALASALPYYGYVVLSFDERGHGDSRPENGGGYARTMDPAAETQDARALLDWAYEHADSYFLATEPGSGIERDLVVGALGSSYGGAFQLPLAAIDRRLDAIVPSATWHSLDNSLIPNAAVKLSWNAYLCLFAEVAPVAETPLVATLCNILGLASPVAFNMRSIEDVERVAAGESAWPAYPRPVSAEELETFITRHGLADFRARQLAGEPWGYGESVAELAPIPALFVQGNRDVLFNLTEAYWNQRYFLEAGADARVISHEGAHMNPLVGQLEGTANCGSIVAVDAILGWLEQHLKAGPEVGLPNVCLSVEDTLGAPAGTDLAVGLGSFPFGSLSGEGALPASAGTLLAELPSGSERPVFLPISTIREDGLVLAGVPTIGRLTVTALDRELQSNNAFIGIGISRQGRLILVDDQITGFAEGVHTGNRNVDQDGVIALPAVGERLQVGDRVGLLAFPQQAQFASVNSAVGAATIGKAVVREVLGQPVSPIISSLNPLAGKLYLNPYRIRAEAVQLPIFAPGRYAGSAWLGEP